MIKESFDDCFAYAFFRELAINKLVISLGNLVVKITIKGSNAVEFICNNCGFIDNSVIEQR